MVLLVLCMPILVLLLALALEQLEARLLPAREVAPRDDDELGYELTGRPARLHPPRVTNGMPSPP